MSAAPADPGSQEAFRAELARLRERFRSRLPERLECIRTLGGRAAAGPDQEARREFHRALHSLAGTAPTHGFAGLAAPARTLMALAAPGLEDAAEPPLDPELLRSGLALLARAVEEAMATDTP